MFKIFVMALQLSVQVLLKNAVPENFRKFLHFQHDCYLLREYIFPPSVVSDIDMIVFVVLEQMYPYK